MQYAAILEVQFSELEEWEEEIQSDAKLRGIIQDLLRDSASRPGYSFQDMKLLYDGW